MQGDLPNSLNVPSNSAFCGLADRLYSDTAQILSPNPQFCGFVANAQGWGLHLGWHWFKAIELQTRKIVGSKLNFSNPLARWYSPEPTIYWVWGSICIFAQEANTLFSTNVQNDESSVGQIQEIGKVVRATHESPNLGKLWV
jgi:hypothetical protein